MVKINTYKYSEKDKSEGKPPKLKETQGACILRHIRNALAHGLVYKLPKGKVLLKDHANFDDSAAVSGYILTTLDSLINLMDTLKRGSSLFLVGSR